MPRFDRTGPMGTGPGTGRGMGPCGPPAGGRRAGRGYGYGLGPGLGWGRGWGRVMCGWFHRKYQGMPKNERKELLKAEIEDLKQETKLVEEELKGLEK